MSETVDAVDTEVSDVSGAFVYSLKRANSKIKADRAEAIEEDANIIFKRTVEDIRIKINKMKREREGMLDMSPENVTTLVLAADFDAAEYVSKDLELGVKIRNLEIKLEIAEERYKYLFGGTA